MKKLITEKGAEKYELVDNYRSKRNIVDFSNQWVSKITSRLKHFPGFAKQKDNGSIRVIEYSSSKLIKPLIAALASERQIGSTCILTKTNDEAVHTVGLLLQKAIPAKLVQSNDGFNLSNLYELRWFSDKLNLDAGSPVIDEEDWTSATSQLPGELNKSSKLNLALKVIKQFSVVNPLRKYKSDWSAFLAESKIEDFVEIDGETIIVSTIHKAKGKEFDNVILLLNQFNVDSDEQKRLLYVAMTRAKSILTIHYNNSFLRELSSENLIYQQDPAQYTGIDQITLLLSMKEVNLGYFGFVQPRINGLNSGSPLTILPDGLGNSNKEKVISFSNQFKETLAGWQSRGFELEKATVNFIVYWKDNIGGKEVKVLLPELLLKKKLQ
jgi:ATP-dependent DNA helicase RecQ